jgi:tetratricopeptide (TPR) repeat protein
VEIGSVAALAGTDLVRARRLVDQLSDANLVTYASADRVTTHDLLRTFARNQVLPCMTEDDRRAATVRLLDHNLLLAAASDAFLDPHRYRTPLPVPDTLGAARRFPDHAAALNWLHGEWPSLVKLCRLAAESGLHEHCWQLAAMLRQYFFLTKQWEHWISTQLDAVSAARASGDRQKLAIAVSNLGTAHFDRGDLPVAVGYFQEALGLFRDAEDEHGITTATSHLAWTALYFGDPENALHDLRSVLVSYRRASNTRNAAIALRGIALAETELARYADAVRHAEMARAEFEALDLRLDVAMAVTCTAWAHYHAGNHAEALLRYEEAATLAEKCGSRYETARALTGRGNVHAATGHRAEAAERWAEADEMCGTLDPVVVGEARVRAAI